MRNEHDEMAFGFSRNLSYFKQIVPHAKNYRDMGLDPYAPDFASQVFAKMQEASVIHFDLSGMTMLNTPDGVLRGPVEYNPLGSTNWELRTIWDNPTLKSKTLFYVNSKKILVEEVLKLS